jgi:hypothetical protein
VASTSLNSICMYIVVEEYVASKVHSWETTLMHTAHSFHGPLDGCLTSTPARLDRVILKLSLAPDSSTLVPPLSPLAQTRPHRS